MRQKLSRWGIGPEIALGTLIYAAAAGAATHRWPTLFRFYLLPYSLLAMVAGVLLLIGLPMLMIAARSIMMGYKHDQLVTTGIAGLVRHPIYSAWIVFIVPAVALLSRSWPLFFMPLVAYLIFKVLHPREDENLQEQFGSGYEDYRASVNELIPIPNLQQPNRNRAHSSTRVRGQEAEKWRSE